MAALSLSGQVSQRSTGCALIALGFALLTIAGKLFAVPFLEHPWPGYSQVPGYAALAIAAVSLGLIASPQSSTAQALRFGAGGLAIGLSLISLAKIIAGPDTGVTWLSGNTALAAGLFSPMSSNSATSLLLSGLVLVGIRQHMDYAGILRLRKLAGLVLALGILSLLTYPLGLDFLDDSPGISRSPVSVSLVLCLLAYGLLQRLGQMLPNGKEGEDGGRRAIAEYGLLVLFILTFSAGLAGMSLTTRASQNQAREPASTGDSGHAIVVEAGAGERYAQARRQFRLLVPLMGLLTLAGYLVLRPGFARIAENSLRLQKEVNGTAAALKQFAETSPDMLFRLKPDGSYIQASATAVEILGYQPAELSGRPFIENSHPEDLPKLRQLLFELNFRRDQAVAGHRLRHRQGHWVWVETRFHRLRDAQDGSPLEIAGSMRDVTHSRAAELAAHNSVARFAVAAAAGFDAFSILGCVRDERGDIRDFSFVFVNGKAEEWFGLKSAALLGKHMSACLQPSRDLRFFERYKQVVESRLPIEDEFPIDIAQPELGWMRYRILPAGDGIAITARDITEQRAADKALRDSEQRFAAAMEDSRELFAMLDAIVDAGGAVVDFQLRFANSLAALRIGAVPGELIGKRLRSMFPETVLNGAFESCRRVFETGEPLEREVALPDTGQRETWLQARVTRLGDGIAITASDISERRYRDESTRSALREKDILLKEIHHRVKNNLQIVDSLLGVQASYFEDAAVQSLLRDCQNRIRSMALVHKTLYQSENFAKVDFREFLDSLVPSLIASYGLEERLSLQVDTVPVMLPMNLAIPCGLIVNELIVNAIKHAFPDNRDGEIHIALSTLNRDEVILSVSDNGVGLPEGIDLVQSSTLGLQLINIMADQLRGEISLRPRNPTRISLRFGY